MRTVYLKTTLANPNLANLTLSDPGPLGSDGDRVIRYAVTDVPESASDLDVLRAFSQVAPMRATDRDRSDPTSWTYRYAELRPGALLR
jgi:hypothetical protein